MKLITEEFKLLPFQKFQRLLL